jgi:hypothetical protein
VFLLKVYWPTSLAFIQNPANFPWPFDMLIASATYQGWIHRFDNFNSGPDANPVDYSQMFTCNIGVLLIPTLIFLYTLGALLLFDPVSSLLWAAILVFVWLLGNLDRHVFFLTASHTGAAAFLVFAFTIGFVMPFVLLPQRYYEAREAQEAGGGN